MKIKKTIQNLKIHLVSYSESLIEKLEIDNIYTIIHSNFNSIFDLDENTSISTENLLSKISNNKKEISKLETNIASENDKLENAEGMIRSAIHQRNKYTETIGIETIEKVREKAAKKEEKGKTLKGRKGVIFSIISSQDSTEKINKNIVSNCKNEISSFENEISIRKKLIEVLEKNYQLITDVQAMQNQYKKFNKIDCDNFNTLRDYTLTEEIKIVTTLKKGNYTIPKQPYKWKKALLEADYLVEQPIDDEMKLKIKQKYINSGGTFRDLTTEEGYARGLITTIIQPVKDVIFDNIYMKNRIDIPLNLDSITFIPHTNIKYNFAAREFKPNMIEQSQGEIEKYFFKIYANYDDVFSGMDEENKVLRKNGERENIEIGSLEKTITNGNWGE